jgi:hypothetical protein
VRSSGTRPKILVDLQPALADQGAIDDDLITCSHDEDVAPDDLSRAN